MLFTGLAVGLGGLVAQRITASARAENPALPALRSWAPFRVLAGLVGVVALAVLLPASPGAAEALWTGRPGQPLLAEAVGFAAALALVALRRPGWAAVPLLVVIAAEGIRSHCSTGRGVSRSRR